MDVLKALVITFISLNSQLFGQPLVQVREDSNLPSVPFTVDIIYANFNTVYISNVSMEQQRVFVYRYNETNKTTAIRVSTFSTEAQDDFPITFVVREQEDILSWMIPVSAGFDYTFPSMDRTLCPMDETKRLNLTSPQRVYVIVETMSDTIRSFSVNATILPDFELVHGQDRELTASPSQPQYYMYTFPKDVDTVLLRVTSNSNLCAVISVQPIRCPVLDLDEDIGSLGKHQTMTKKAAFFLEKKDYHKFQAFYVIVLVKPKLTDCSAPDDTPPQERLNVTTKTLSILITNTIPRSKMDGAIGWVMLIYILISAGFFIPCCAGNIYVRSKNTARQTDCEDEVVIVSSPSIYQAILGTAHDQTNEVQTNETYKLLSKPFRIYIWILIAVAMFYGIPAAQLVFSYQKTLRQTGDEDLCYYNFDCAFPYQIGALEFSAFNNIFSNIGYLILGLLFIAIVKMRSLRWEAYMQENRQWIPKQYGLQYAMGVALMVVGIMSAIYHFCPTNYNYQFDTTFMYVILCLCIMKIFEIQLPSTQPRAHILFFFMAWITLLAVLGMVFQDKPLFWFFYSLLSLNLTIGFGFLVSSNVCSLCCCNCLCKDKTWCQEDDVLTEFCPHMCGGFHLLINVVISVILKVVVKLDFATFLLAILLLNFVLYLVMYVAMKCKKKCKKTRTSFCIFLLALGVWIGAIFSFKHSQSAWESSPETSRQKNEPCAFLEFYDYHDIWHFLSAVAIFLSLLMFLTIDDELIDSDVYHCAKWVWTAVKTKLAAMTSSDSSS